MELDGLKVNHGSLEGAADDMLQTVRKIDARMADLDRELSELKTRWTGGAQEAYVRAKTKWDTAINEMRNLLEDTSRQVHQSNADYKAADARGAAAFDI